MASVEFLLALQNKRLRVPRQMLPLEFLVTRSFSRFDIAAVEYLCGFSLLRILSTRQNLFCFWIILSPPTDDSHTAALASNPSAETYASYPRPRNHPPPDTLETS